MMEHLPPYIPMVFMLTTALTLWIFYKASRRSAKVLWISLLWLVLQGIIALTGFYTNLQVLPPRFLLTIVPPLLFFIFLFATKQGRLFVDGLDLRLLTLLHTIRVPVELVLFWLFTEGTIPRIMTFEGRNWDILSGITAPVVYLLLKTGSRRNNILLLAWNLLCLALLVNIVTIAILSAPFPFQQLAFEQPNRAVLQFPFVWLPAFVVPVVLLSHLAAIRKLLYKTT